MKNLFTALLALTILSGAGSSLRAQEGTWLKLTHANSNLPGDSVTSIAFDNNGTLWVAARQGAAKYNAPGWSRYDSMKYMPSNDIWDLDFANGSMFFAHRNGLTAFDGSTWSTYTSSNSGLVNQPVLCLAHDNSQNLWIGTARGLGRFSREKTWTSYKRENTPAMPYDGIQTLTNDGTNLWMSFIGTAGLVTFPGGQSQNAKYIKQDSVPGFPKGAVYIMSLAVDGTGNLWAGTRKNGVIRITSSGATVFSKSIPAIRDSNVRVIAVNDCAKEIWIGTDAGAAFYDGTTWREVSKRTGHLPNDTVNTITLDPAGHIWFGTQGGIAEYKPLPQPVSLVNPGNAVIVTTDSITCNWSRSCPGIVKYWYEIADNPSFANSRIDTSSASLTESAAKIEGPFVNRQIYYWRVKAKNDAGWGPFGPTWSFTYIMPLPSKPALIAPQDGVTIGADSITARWGTAQPHVDGYWFERATNPGFEGSFIDTTTLSEGPSTSYRNSNLDDHATYYWRVKARNAEGWGAFSDTWRFTYFSTSRVQAAARPTHNLRIFPNPTRDKLTVQFMLEHREPIQIVLYNERGDPVISPIIGILEVGTYNIPIDISPYLSSGAYHVELRVGTHQETAKVQLIH